MEGLTLEMSKMLINILLKVPTLEFLPMMNLLVSGIKSVLHVERCAIFRVIEEVEELQLIVGEPKEEHGIGMKFSFNDLPALREAVEKKTEVIVEDPLTDPRTENTRDLIYFKQINAILIVPLKTKEKVIGVTTIDATKEKKSFTTQEVYFVKILNNLVGILLERELLVKEKAEKQVLMLLGQAAAEAAHRLRNPLVVIGGYARRLWKSLIGEEREKVRVIMEETKKLEELVNNLLRFSSQRGGNRIEVDLNEIIQEVEEVTREIISQSGKNIILKTKLEPLLPVFVNPEEIREVILSIIRNAVEAIEKEGEILLRTKKREDELYLSITNDGGCISEDIIEQIFNPFFTTKSGGTGLGLAIAQKIISSHGGEIKVEVDKDLQLTTFTIELPQR